MNLKQAKLAVKRQSPDARKAMISATKVDNDTVDLWVRDRKELPAEVAELIIAFVDGDYVHISTAEGLQLMPRPKPAVLAAAVPQPPYDGGQTAYAIGQPALGCTPYLMTKKGGPVMGGKNGTKPITQALMNFGRG